MTLTPQEIERIRAETNDILASFIRHYDPDDVNLVCDAAQRGLEAEQELDVMRGDLQFYKETAVTLTLVTHTHPQADQEVSA